MNHIIVFAIIALVIYHIASQCPHNKEHMNEGTLNHVLPHLHNNFDPAQYLNCHKDIRSNAHGNTYCNDVPTYRKYKHNLFKSPYWQQTELKSFFYPPYSLDVQNTFAPDWTHIIDN